MRTDGVGAVRGTAGRVATVLGAVVGLLVAGAQAPAAPSPPAARTGTAGCPDASPATASATGNGRSQNVAVSPDGRYAAFLSLASDLVPGDTNEASDVVLRDRRTGANELISATPDGTPGNQDSFGPQISRGGRYVVFTSDASDLVPGDTNDEMDVFVRDRDGDTTRRVSVAPDRTQGDGKSFRTMISGNGRYVVFTSDSSNLVPGDTNGLVDSFRYDLRTGDMERVTTAADGTQGNGLGAGVTVSENGRYVAFTSQASNLVPGDTNGQADVFVRDMRRGTLVRASVGADGAQAADGSSGTISPDGRYVAFTSRAGNLVPGDTNGKADVFLRDVRRGTTERVAVGADGSEPDDDSTLYPLVNSGGRYVAFTSQASNLVPGDSNGLWDVFVRDRERGVTERVSVATGGAEGNGESARDHVGMGLSADGSLMAYVSAADNLVRGDGNGVQDAVARDRASGTTEALSARHPQAASCAGTAATPAAAGYTVLEDARRGQVLTAAPGVTDKSALLGDGSLVANSAADVPDSRRLNNDYPLALDERRTVTPPGGSPAALSAQGGSHLRLPFFARPVGSFTSSASQVAWEGSMPFDADRVIHSDTWRVLVVPSGGSVSFTGGPAGAERVGSDALRWQTEVQDGWLSAHTWDRLDFTTQGTVFQVRYTVTGTFQFGSAFFRVEGEDRGSI
ncbi:hypothetical protein [Streptomyces sp. NPDC050704]|uniref:hypothetical protein n=1 Tax=Streptomyces sp. NPDC050704 TaxID=3157219 RepID=UPI003448C0F9